MNELQEKRNFKNILFHWKKLENVSTYVTVHISLGLTYNMVTADLTNIFAVETIDEEYIEVFPMTCHSS